VENFFRTSEIFKETGVPQPTGPSYLVDEPSEGIKSVMYYLDLLEASEQSICWPREKSINENPSKLKNNIF
jgi:hypothetical protein